MVSIVIPAYNEERGIAETINSIRRVFEQSNKPAPEIIVVDDGSTDKTTEVCLGLNVKSIRNPVNTGYGFSLKRGIAAAANDTIVIIDADGTYPIEQIVPLLEVYNQGFDMVVGARQGTYYEQSLLKKSLRFFLKILVEYTTNNNIPDINSGLRIFSKEEANKHMQRLSNAFSFTTSITLVYLLNHRFVTYVPIGYNKRVGNSKVKIIRDIFRTLQYIIEIILYFNPVKIYILFFGFIVLQGIISSALWMLTRWVVFDYVVLADVLALPVVMIAAMLAMQFKQYNDPRD
jgi:glycosyltransferase involved in cell wall biosynthesis